MRGQLDAAVEVGAGDVHAVVGEDVVLALERGARRSGPTRTTEKSEVPPPMSATSTICSRVDAASRSRSAAAIGSYWNCDLAKADLRARPAAARPAAWASRAGSSSTKNTGRPSTGARDRRAGLALRRSASGAAGSRRRCRGSARRGRRRRRWSGRPGCEPRMLFIERISRPSSRRRRPRPRRGRRRAAGRRARPAFDEVEDRGRHRRLAGFELDQAHRRAARPARRWPSWRCRSRWRRRRAWPSGSRERGGILGVVRLAAHALPPDRHCMTTPNPRTRAWRWLLLVLAAAIAALALTPVPPEQAGLGWDKLNHLAAFASLALCAVFGWRSSRAARLAVLVGAAGLRRRDRAVATACAATAPANGATCWPTASASAWVRCSRWWWLRRRTRITTLMMPLEGPPHERHLSKTSSTRALPICDPHHHLWDRHGNRYLLDELLADTGQADARGARHNVRSTVFVECASMYRADGPAALRPVGETEFVNGVAAMSASGGYGDTRVAAGIVVLRRPAPRRRGARGARGTHRARHASASAASAMPPAGMPASRSAIRTATRPSTCCWTAAFAKALRSWRRWV